MIVSLDLIRHKTRKSLPQIKNILNNYKIDGGVFFKEDISLLKNTDLFELFYSHFPNERTSPEAFPIPICAYAYFDDRMERLYFLKEYFERYHMKSINDLHFFHSFDSNKPYISRNYLWFYK